MTLLFADSLFLKHETGRHPERPERLRKIAAHMKAAGIERRLPRGEFQPLTEAAVQELHSAEMIEGVRELAERGGGNLDADTVVSPRSLEVALAAAGACTAAVDAVIAGPERTALCLVRPPGHHATPDRSMGFCLFNNVALAAHHARQQHQLSRILIVDWDVHHGNGTQDIFYADPGVFFLDIHRFPFWPGTGSAAETGTGPGLGYTLNVPVAFGTPPRGYHARFADALAHAADKIKPELVFVSAGFDAHARDPIGSLGLEVEDFAEMTQRVVQVARTHAEGRIVSCLEGGYGLDVLPRCVEAHLRSFEF